MDVVVSAVQGDREVIAGGQAALAEASLGSTDDLRAAHAAALRSDPHGSVMLAYLLYMTTGQTALADLRTHRHPEIGLERFADHVACSLSATVDA